MEHCLINKKLQNLYKEDFLNKNYTFFAHKISNFNLEDFTIDEELKKIVSYLPYVKKISIYIDITMIDFLNLIYTITFLLDNGYQNDFEICYVSNFEKKYIKDEFLTNKDAQEFFDVRQFLKNQKDLKNTLAKKIWHYNICMNMITSTFLNPTMFDMLIKQAYEDNLHNFDQTISYLINKYPQYGFDRKFYENYLSKKEYYE